MAVKLPGLFDAKPLPEDKLRIGITWLFSGTFVVFLVIYLCAAFTIQSNDAWLRVKEAFGVILPALTGILGTVIGFYFGNRNKS
jgi:hypothetical protein